MRREHRTEVCVPVQVMWTDLQGNERYATGQILDICTSGMRIQVPEPIPQRSYVRLRADQLALAGSASVRACMRKGTKHLIGLEFSGGMTWKRPQSQVEDVLPHVTETEPVPR
jgi:hypothetical protein